MIQKLKFANHDEWLFIRSKYIGGSDAGAVVGMNPYKSAYTLWAEKTGKIPSFEGNLTTEVGAFLEEFVAKYFEKQEVKKVQRSNFTYVNDKYPFACANVDRMVVGENAILEIKTTNSLPNMKKIKGGEFPDSWYCQMLHYLAVTEKEKAYLAVLVGGRDFYTFTLERDEDEINALMKAEEQFWDCVTKGIQPSIDGSDSSSKTIGLQYPISGEGEVDLTAFESELRQYIELGEQIKVLENAQKECANRVKLYMEESGKGSSLNYNVSFKSTEKKTFDAKRFAEEHSSMDLSTYYKTSNYRTFKVTEIKKK